MRWTNEQKTVIELRDCNILVSAAAGSGKTAVLVERILSRLLEREDPLDIDEFVIVTFTAAAAAQMRERIGEAIDKAVAENPKNEHLAKQVTLLHNAQISTIHSFCGNVIRGYFHRIGIEPSYRLMTGREAELMRSDVLAEVLEENYSNPTDSFMELLDCYKFDRSDKELEHYILTLYDKAMSEPWPEEWLKRNRDMLSVSSLSDMEQSDVIRELKKYIACIMDDIRCRLSSLKKICEQPDGPNMYLDRIEADMNMLPHVEDGTSLSDLKRIFMVMDFGRLSSKASSLCLPEKRERVKQQRTEIKKVLQDLQSDFFFSSSEAQWEDVKKMSGNLLELIRLTECFLRCFTDKKREKALADFNDLEQLALEILIGKNEDGEIVRTEAAVELSRRYREIMIDEYQDSNLVQDILLKAISREEEGRPNIFMVGDIKQSIYRFRQARPELFTSKLEKYSKEKGKYRRVDLHKNFRSRDIIIESTNRIFKDVMKRDMGGVEYDDEAALYPGADFPDFAERVSKTTEVLALDGSDSDFELEAKIIAKRIRELTDKDTGIMIWDGKQYRLAEYRDIVILGRSVKKMIPALERVLNGEGIPTSAKRSEGFYETKEVSMVVNMLRVLDNPRQDIPLVALLRSGMFSFDDEELAQIKGDKEKQDYYTYLIEYDGSPILKNKIRNFLEIIIEIRKKLSYAKVTDIIKDIYEKTNLYDIVLVMPGSVQRGANLDMLMEQAILFDGTAYQGLFQFVRYLERVKSSESDEGEAVLASENDNAVRILTIHASKGLEYPVCFLAGMGGNLGGARNQWLHIHSQLGIGTEAVDNEARIRRPTLIRNCIAKFNELEDLGEELRVLYVAMTRGKEKVIFTGSGKNWKNKKEKWLIAEHSYLDRSSGKTFFDFIMPTILQSEDSVFRLKEYEENDLLQMEYRKELENVLDFEMLNNFDTSQVYDKQVAKTLLHMEQFSYPNQDCDLPIKVSVSDLKKQSMEEEGIPEFSLFNHEAISAEPTYPDMPIPEFVSSEEETEKTFGAKRATAYGLVWHQVMANIDFTMIHSLEDIEREIEDLIREGKLNPKDANMIETPKLFDFFQSQLGREMTEAMKAGRCYREQPFVLGMPAKEIFPGRESEKMVLVQGIMDAFYETSEGIILLDYKTDRIAFGEEEVLIQRYRKQIDFYKKALERITGKKVVKCILYSFSLRESIIL